MTDSKYYCIVRKCNTSTTTIKQQLIFRDTPHSKHPPRWNGESKDCRRKEIILAPGEKVTKVCGRAGDIIDHLEIGTDRGQSITAGSSSGGAYFCSDNGADVCGLYGGFGGHLHNIGFIYRKTEVGGGSCSTSTSAAGSGSAAASSAESGSEKPGNVVCVDGVCRFEPKERVVAGGSSSTAEGAGKPAPASPSPLTAEGKAAMQARIKLLFDQFVREGKAPNDAAAMALKEVGKEQNK